MADSNVAITAGTGTNIDTRTEATNGHHRQVVVLGDPATNAGVAPVDATAGLKVDLGGDNDVTVTGTVDLGATDNAVLDTIAAKDFATQTTLAAINAKMVTGTDIGDVTINNSTGAAAVNIQDGGNTITVDGTVAVTNAGITTIAGAVAGTEMQVDVLTMPTVAVTQSGTWDEVGINDSGNSITVDGTVTANLAAGTNNIGDIDVLTLPAIPTGTNAIGRVGHDITGMGNGVTTVTTAGTDVALAASTTCKRVVIQSQTDNTGLIAVGASGVDATVATGTGIILNPGDSFEIEIDNLADVYIDSTVNGEGVRYTYFT